MVGDNRRLLGGMADNPNSHDQSRVLLLRVSEALGLPIERFYGDAPGEAEKLLTLMRSWSSIGDRQARQRILTVARQEFELFG